MLVGCGDDDDSDGQALPATTTPTAAGEPPPEVTSIRIPRTYTACMAPLLFAQDYLLEDGIEVEYITRDADYALIDDVAAGKIDMGYYFIPPLAHAVDAGLPIVMLGGAHTACFQIIAVPEVRDLADLRGRRIGIVVREPQAGDYSFVAAILQRIGIAPGSDVELVPVKRADVLTALGPRVDAMLVTLAHTLTLRDTNQGHVLIDSVADAPWSQNICCAFFANREFVEANPVTTRRGLRAMLKAVDHSARDSAGAAARFVEEGWVVTNAYATRTLDEVSLDVWRSHDVADAIRFYGLYLHEAGLVSSTPEEIIAKGTDLTFFNELKSELAYAPGGANRNLSFYCDPATGAIVRGNTGPTGQRRTT
jgi:NitT/TauT family transport system substrate-binding protein